MAIFISEISVEQTFNLGNYENIKLGIKVSQTMTEGGDPVTDKDMWKTGIESVSNAFRYSQAQIKARKELESKKAKQIQATLGQIQQNALIAQGEPK